MIPISNVLEHRNSDDEWNESDGIVKSSRFARWKFFSRDSNMTWNQKKKK